MEHARQRLETQVLERAAKDPQFREQLKRDPRGTVVRDIGVQIPTDITVEVVEETPSKVYLVLPAAAAQPGQGLTDQDLEAVAGGWSGRTDCLGTCGIYTCAGTGVCECAQ